VLIGNTLPAPHIVLGSLENLVTGAVKHKNHGGFAGRWAEIYLVVAGDPFQTMVESTTAPLPSRLVRAGTCRRDKQQANQRPEIFIPTIFIIFRTSSRILTSDDWREKPRLRKS